MSIPVSINDRLEAAALKAEGGSEIMRRFANDPAGAYITTESGPLPSLAEWLALNATALGGVPALQAFVQSLQTALAGQGGDLVGWQRAPLAGAISAVGAMLSTTRVNIWEFAHLVSVKPNPADPGTWDWSPAVQAAFDSMATINGGVVDFGAGYFKWSGVTCSKKVGISGHSPSACRLGNFTAGATMLTYTQSGLNSFDQLNWLVLSGFTIRDEGSFTGKGIVFNQAYTVAIQDAHFVDFRSGWGLDVSETLWFVLQRTNFDLCGARFISVLDPHFNNVITIQQSEFHNPTGGKSSLYIENADVVSLRDVTIEGDFAPPYRAGAELKGVKMLCIDGGYYEVLPNAALGPIALTNCQAVEITKALIGSGSVTVPDLYVDNCDNVKVSESSLVWFPIRAFGFSSVTFERCLTEGPMDIGGSVSFRNESPMPFNTRAVLHTNPEYQARRLGKPKAFRNSYADSAFESAAPGTSIIAGAPVSSQDTSQGYYGTTSWRVAGLAGDSIRSGTLGVTVSNGQSGCFSFMAKADTAGRFSLTNLIGGVTAGGQDIYLGTGWRRYFSVTNLTPASVAGAAYQLQLAFQGANAFNVTDIQFIPFTDYGEIPGIVDGFNYIPTHGTAQAGAVSREVAPAAVYFSRGISLRKMTTAPAAPSDGFIYYADGTSWNPGSGAGVYLYNGSTYTKL